MGILHVLTIIGNFNLHCTASHSHMILLTIAKSVVTFEVGITPM